MIFDIAKSIALLSQENDTKRTKTFHKIDEEGTLYFIVTYAESQKLLKDTAKQQKRKQAPAPKKRIKKLAPKQEPSTLLC